MFLNPYTLFETPGTLVKIKFGLKSKHHLTTPQAFAAAVEVANKLFGCNWKHHSSAEVIDSDTAPHIKNSREAGKAITVLALSSKVDEMMESGNNLNIF